MQRKEYKNDLTTLHDVMTPVYKFYQRAFLIFENISNGLTVAFIYIH